MSNELKYFQLLGHNVRDKITGLEGIVDSVSFDLYGCVQVIVRPPGFDKDGELKKGLWLDWKRLVIISDKPLMARPTFEAANFEEPGPADKPAR